MSDEQSPHEMSQRLRTVTNSMLNSANKRSLQHLIGVVEEMKKEREEAAEVIKKHAELIKKLRGALRVQNNKRSSSMKGGKGRNALIRSQELDDAFLTGISSHFEMRVLIELCAMPPNGWLKYDESNTSWCMKILSVLGYVGENRTSLPDFCLDKHEALRNANDGAMNCKRQQFTAAMVKRLRSKMLCK